MDANTLQLITCGGVWLTNAIWFVMLVYAVRELRRRR